MKVRSGFVSNSSSSSFTMVTTKAWHEAVVASLTPEQREFMESVMPREATIGFDKFMVITGTHGNCGDWIGAYEIRSDDDYDMWQAYLVKVGRENYIYTDVGM